MKIRKIAVGSTNPVKLAAVEEEVAGFLSQVEVVGVEIDSGVKEQPMSDEETRRGAEERARKAREKVAADVGIGLEGGVYKHKGEVWNTVWCVVTSSKEVIPVSGVRFKLPAKIARKIMKGNELGPIMDKFLGRKDVKKQEGMLGVVTDGWVKRKEGYGQLVRLAMGRLLTKEWR